MTAKELSVRLHELLTQQHAQVPKLTEADRLAAQGNSQAAAQRYEEALMEPGARPRALSGLIQALAATGQTERCIEVYQQHALQLGKSALATDCASYAASCLESLEDADRRQKLRRRLRSDVEQLLADPEAELSVDDRSDAYGTMIELSDALGEKPSVTRFRKSDFTCSSKRRKRPRIPSKPRRLMRIASSAIADWDAGSPQNRCCCRRNRRCRKTTIRRRGWLGCITKRDELKKRWRGSIGRCR